MARCYDKWVAHGIATTAGIDCPATALASDAAGLSFPIVVKPRWGSDSLGMRLVRTRPIPKRARSAGFIAQERIVGAELTVAVIHDCVGMPLRLDLPAGTPYSFARKYLLRPHRTPVADEALAERVRRLATEIAGVYAVDWAARIDLIHETATGRLRLLECDVAPLVGPGSAFAASLAAAGVPRAEQLAARRSLRRRNGETASAGQRCAASRARSFAAMYARCGTCRRSAILRTTCCSCALRSASA